MILQPLTEPLENMPTTLNCYRFLGYEQIMDQLKWGAMCQEINNRYKALGFPPYILKREKQKFGYSKYKKKRAVYPVEFIPEMLIIIKKHYNAAKPKRKRITNLVEKVEIQ